MKPAKQQLHQLDVLRGVCAVCVMLHHMQFEYPGRSSPLIRHADLLVDFFFVLSGFIMLHSYRSMTTGPQLLRFLGMRVLRVYPLHLVMLGVFVAYEFVQYVLVSQLGMSASSPPFSTNDGYAFVLGLTLLNGVGLHRLSFNIPSWSISTELWSYLVFGLTLTLASGRRRLLYPAFGFLTLSGLLILVSRPQPSLTEDYRYFLPRCVCGFFLGALVRLALPEPRAGETRFGQQLGSLAQGASLASFLVLTYAISEETLWLELLTPLTFAGLIASLVYWPTTPIVRLIDLRFLRWLGLLSYSIYMVHMIIVLVVQAFVRIVLHAPFQGDVIHVHPGFGAVLVLLCLAATLGVAAMTYRYVEEPGRRLGRRLFGADPKSFSVLARAGARAQPDDVAESAQKFEP